MIIPINMLNKVKIFEKLYSLLLLAVAVLIIFHHFLFNFDLFGLDEEFVEAAVLTSFIFAAYVIHRLYSREVRKNFVEMEKLKETERDYEKIVEEVFKYVGALNVQIDHVKSIFSDLKKYPENKKDFKYIQEYLAGKILGIVQTDFIIFRIVDLASANTLSEYELTRNGTAMPDLKIGNADLLEGKEVAGCRYFKSDQRNLKIKVFCALSPVETDEDQKVFISAIVNQLEMLFLVFSSIYYQDSHLLEN